MHRDREARLGAAGFVISCKLLPYVQPPVDSELLTPQH